MPAGGALLHPPHGLGMLLNYRRSDRFKIVELRRAHVASARLSSRASWQDVWSINVSDSIHSQLYCTSKYNVLRCRSFSISSYADKVHLKTATSALNRSYTALLNSPHVIQLAPAFGIIAFSIWGVGPLIRHCRNLFLQRNDSNWKKSRTYYIATSYLQPLLLWAGVTLICKALDPIILLSEASQAIKQRLLSFGRSLSTVLAFAYFISNLIQQTQKFFLERNDTSDTSRMGFQFAGKALYTAVWVAAISLFMELLGFSTKKWITAGGLGTVLLTLAGREILTNFLSSIMIHATRPFLMNEWVQMKIEGYEVSGTVEHLGWWSPTIIRGEDGEAVHIPNHKFTVNIVRNLSQKTHWRIKTYLAISHLDANKINNIVADMRKVLAKNPQVEHRRLHRRVFLENIDPENQALLILISCFVKTSHLEEYLCVKESILLDLLRVISHHRARLATPIRTVQKLYGDPKLDNIPFAETIFTRSGSPGDHSLLLLEPPTRVNGSDKVKNRTSPRANEEHTVKPTASSEAKSTPVSEGTVQPTGQPQQKVKPGDADPRIIKSDPLAGPASNSPKSHRDVLEAERPPTLEADSEQDGIPHKVQAKLESERSATAPLPMARPALEDNIVLGVALGGSKRTLPIEEGIGPTSVAQDMKGFTAARNGAGSSSSSVKDMKEGQVPAVPDSVGTDPRDKEKLG